MKTPEHMSDKEVLTRLKLLVRLERENLPELFSCLAEVDRRKLYAPLGFSSTFDYCVGELRYSDGEAYRRIHAARAAKRHMEIYSHLADGSLSVWAVSRLAPHLTSENAAALLSRAAGMRSRELDIMIAELEGPRPMPPDRVRPIRVELRPAQDCSASCGALGPGFNESVAPVETICFEHSFVASQDFEAELERLKNLLASKHPFGRLEDYLREAVSEYLERHEPGRVGQPLSVDDEGEGASSRHVPRGLRDAVWARDGGRCAFVSDGGRRCSCRRSLQVDHIVPLATGGKTVLSNLRLLCPEHNQLERRRKLGEGRGPSRASLKLLKEESAQLPLPS